MQKKEDPSRIKDIINGILSGLTGEKISEVKKSSNDKPKGILFEEEIRKIWKETVGDKAAKHSKPTSIRKGRMTILVDNSAWLYELNMGKERIIDFLNLKLEKKIEEIRFKIGEV